MVEVERDLLRSANPTLLLRAGSVRADCQVPHSAGFSVLLSN